MTRIINLTCHRCGCDFIGDSKRKYCTICKEEMMGNKVFRPIFMANGCGDHLRWDLYNRNYRKEYEAMCISSMQRNMNYNITNPF